MVAAALAAGAAVALVLWARPGAADKPETGPLFQTADRCMACHNELLTPEGDDASIGTAWRPAMMANAARDPYWHAAVRREVTDHPSAQAAIEDECSKCHMPMARFEAHAVGGKGQIFANLPAGQGQGRTAHLAADGVSCSICHQITPDGFGSRQSFVGGFAVDESRPMGRRQLFGPFDVDRGRSRVMRSASRMNPTQSDHLQQSEMCATCHTLFTHSLDDRGQVVGELPEQVPYLEWRHSSYRTSHSCQSCHMPEVGQPMPISSVLGQPRSAMSQHVFRGGNFFMMKLLSRYRVEQGVVASIQDLDTAAARTLQHLGSSSAALALRAEPVAADRLEAVVTVTNHSGHKLPTAYPSRRVWLHVVVLDGQGATVFESGAATASGSIQGNDNDLDGARFEPHYGRIERTDQVQIYEAILAAPDGSVTTGLLTATAYVKDNRLLPQGFDKATAHADIAVRGQAATDSDFRAPGDVVRYSVSVAGATGPFRMVVELWYQPVGYRWAHNLGGVAAPETRRFVEMYRSMSSASATRPTRTEAIVRRTE